MERSSENLNRRGAVGQTSETVGFPQQQHSLNPTVSHFIESALHHSPPQDSKAVRSLGSMVRGFNSVFQQRDPMISHFPVQSFGKPARLVFPLFVRTKKMRHSGIPRGDVTLSWGGIRPVDDVVRLRGDPPANPSHPQVLSLGKTYRFAEQMGRTGLPLVHPLAVDSVAVAHQNPCSVPDQFFESLFRPAGPDPEEGHRPVGQHPQTDQDSMLTPGGFVDEDQYAAPSSLGNCHLAERNRFRNEIDTPLNAATTEHGAQKPLTGSLTALRRLH